MRTPADSGDAGRRFRSKAAMIPVHAGPV